MTNHDALHERGRSLEDDFFRRRDRELVEKIRKAAEADEARKGLGQKTGLSDPAILAELHELGFTPDTIVLLPLMPSLQMAWAEGGVTADERELLLALARARGVADGSPAHQQLLDWIQSKPSDAVLAGAGRLIAAVLAAGGETAAGLTAADLVADAEKIASASGGLFGLGRVSVEERRLLGEIKARLGKKG